MTSLYNLKSTPRGWRITKFDDSLNPDTTYEMHYVDKVLHCSCPQMAKPTCRHRKMFPEFQLKARIDTNWFLDFDTKLWRQYVGPFDGLDDPVVNTEPTGKGYDDESIADYDSNQDLEPEASLPVQAKAEESRAISASSAPGEAAVAGSALPSASPGGGFKRRV